MEKSNGSVGINQCVHIWAHTGINIDEMYTSSMAQLGDRKKFLGVIARGN